MWCVYFGAENEKKEIRVLFHFSFLWRSQCTGSYSSFGRFICFTYRIYVHDVHTHICIACAVRTKAHFSFSSWQTHRNEEREHWHMCETVCEITWKCTWQRTAPPNRMDSLSCALSNTLPNTQRTSTVTHVFSRKKRQRIFWLFNSDMCTYIALKFACWYVYDAHRTQNKSLNKGY